MIEHALIITAICWAIHATTWQGMIFEELGAYFDRYDLLPPVDRPRLFPLLKPLYACPICMCPWWGSVYLLCMNVYMYSMNVSEMYINITSSCVPYLAILLTATGFSAIIDLLSRD